MVYLNKFKGRAICKLEISQTQTITTELGNKKLK